MNIVHVRPPICADGALRLHGSTKDILGRTEYFAERGLNVREFAPPLAERVFEALEQARAWPRPDECAVLFESTFCPRALEHLRRRFPGVRVLVRPHNAELPHRLDWARACGFGPRALGWLQHALVNALRDYRSARAAHLLLPISDWESRHYWQRLAGPGKTLPAPFFLPQECLRAMPAASEKKRLCVNLGAARGNPLIHHATNAFHQRVAALSSGGQGWEFVSTGDTSNYRGRVSPRVAPVGVLESPYALLAQARCMALLSSLGGGFKTKILEAIACRAWVIAPGPLVARLPAELRPYCIALRRGDAAEFAWALEQSLAPFPAGDANAALRARAYAALDEAFGLANPAARGPWP